MFGSINRVLGGIGIATDSRMLSIHGFLFFLSLCFFVTFEELIDKLENFFFINVSLKKLSMSLLSRGETVASHNFFFIIFQFKFHIGTFRFILYFIALLK